MQSPHILLVDDDAGVRDATRLLLEIEGARITAASSFEEALERARTAADVDAVVTDYHLSVGPNGLQLIDTLRERMGPQLCAVLLTGDPAAAALCAQREGWLAVLDKPIKADELLTLVRRLKQTQQPATPMRVATPVASFEDIAADVAHELNQPLTAIANYAQACNRLLDAPQPDFAALREATAAIAAQAVRAGDIIRALRKLARNQGRG